MKKLIFIISIILAILSAVFLFRPALPLTFDKSVSENRILIKYTLDSNGPTVIKTLDGGNILAEKLKSVRPTISSDEIVFTDNSAIPDKQINSGVFYGDGFGYEHAFIVEGEAVGITNGTVHSYFSKKGVNIIDTPQEPQFVPLFKADKWYFTSYVPHFVLSDFRWKVSAAAIILLCAAWIFINLISALIIRFRHQNTSKI